MSRFQGLLKKPEIPALVAALAAAGLLVAAIFLPLWRMELVAPQYPKGLIMFAYGDHFAENDETNYDDLWEINELNHYIGMKAIEEVTEMKLFIPSLLALAVVSVASTFLAVRPKLVRWLIIAGFWTLPLFFIADLQYWLYYYGHTLDPSAALDMDSFTPKVVGSTKVWNFHSDNSFETGFWLLVLAGLVITFLPPALRFLSQPNEPAEKPAPASRGPAGQVARIIIAGAAIGVALLGVGRETVAAAESQPASMLQSRIDRAPAGDTLVVEGGSYSGNIRIDKPLSLVGHGWPVIDGGGSGDVLTITASDVFVSGFVVRGSSHALTTEPAAIKVKGADRVQVVGNRLLDSHFGVHLTNSHENTIEGNVLDLGGGTSQARRGHGLYLWQVGHSAVRQNDIRNAADGIHLEFSETNVIADNAVTGSRYGIHFMYANGNKVLRNQIKRNLAGAVLMFSHEVIVKDNVIEENRQGATGAGILVKDCDNLFVEGNRLVRNKFGISVEGSPQSAGASAVFLRNLLALNDTGISVMSNSPITFVENAVVENGLQVRAMTSAAAAQMLGGHGGASDGSTDHSQHQQGAVTTTTDAQAPSGPKSAVWAAEGRGNYWSDFRGYDANGDGVGDRPYEARPAFAGRLESNDGLRAFRLTLAQQAIDAAATMFPISRRAPVLTDAAPLMSPPVSLAAPDARSGVNLPLFAGSLALLAGVGVTVVALGATPRRRPRLVPRLASAQVHR